jgi:hypothetical protein
MSNEVWTYATSTTVTMSGDYSAVYAANMKVRIDQITGSTTVKYFLITNVTYANSTTTLTLDGGSKYTLTSDEITAHYVSDWHTPGGGFPLSDPTYASSSHAHAGSDITSGTLDGDRLPAISTTKKGGVPAAPSPSGKFLKDDGTWATTPDTGVTDHGALTGLSDDDHTQYVKHALSTAASDFLVGSGSNTFIKKTLAETKTVLGLGTAAYTASTDYAVAAKGVTGGDAHDHNGGDGAQIAHANLSGLTNDDHTQYIKHSLSTAASDFLLGSGSNTFVKKTLAETKTALGLGSAAYTASTAYVTHALATAANDFLVASGSGAFVKKTLAETQTVLGLGSAAYTASTAYAVAAKGVTNGDTHDHSGGDGAQIDHGGLGGLSDNDHTQYTLKATLTEKGDIYYASAASTPAALAHGNAGDILQSGGHDGVPSWLAQSTFAVAAKGVTNGDSHDHNGGDGAQIDHGGLGGLSDDDHPQYIKHSLALAANDFLVASGVGVFAKQSLADVKTTLGLGTAAYTASTDYAVAAKGVTGGDSHDHNGGDGAQISHANLSGLSNDDHTQYIKHSLATAASDFLVASGAGVFIKKTLAETKTVLGLGSAAYTASTAYVTHALATAANDFLVASGSGAFVKKTLAETKTVLGLGTAAYTASTDYAVAAKGVTNGDSHDHNGGDGAQIAHANLSGLTNDDHTQYIKHALATAANDFLVASASGTFVKKTLAETKTVLGLGTAAYTAATDYAVAAKGVTNGDTHDHNGGDGAQIDHGGLAGISDDDHTQYPLLAGRSGGQTINGDTAASGNLHISSTANATKGSVMFGDDLEIHDGTGFLTIDSNPMARLSINGDTLERSKILVQSTGVTTANPSIELGSVRMPGYIEMVDGLLIKYLISSAKATFNNISTSGTTAFSFQSGGTDRFVVQTNGKVGINVSSPSVGLELPNTSSTGDIKCYTITTQAATGREPITVSSTTKVNNLNVSYLEGKTSSDFATASHDHDGWVVC